MMKSRLTCIKNFFLPIQGLLRNNFVIAYLALIAVFTPDFVMNGAICSHIVFEPLYALEFFGFLLVLSFCGCTMIFSTLILFALMELINLCYMAYFGQPITASELNNIVLESRDVFDLAYLKQTWFVPLCIFFLYGGALTLIWKAAQKSVRFRFMFIVALYLMAHKPLHALRETKGVWYFQPGPTRSSINNSINVFSYYFFQYLRKGMQTSEIEYTPYSIEKNESDVHNVLLIFGESLASSHMQFFGYPRQTFPRLEAFLKSFFTPPSGSLHKHIGQAISSGIATATSTRLFFNVIREPANLKELREHHANLFRIAHQNGFKTHYFSNQESRLLMDLSEKDIDEIINNDSEPLVFGRLKDEGLVHFLKKIDFQHGKNFVVLHMRSPHSPYENRYQGREAEFEKFKPAAESKNRLEYSVNTYDNALLYTDMVITSMMESFVYANRGRHYAVYLIADHAQLFDFNGMWGHNNLVLEQGFVPFVVVKDNLSTIAPLVSAYEAAKLVAQDLGANIINSNEHDNTYYLHGNNIDFPYSYIEYQLSPEGNVLSQAQKYTTAP